MERAFCLVNALVYVGLAAWCTFAVDGTAAAIGYRFARVGARIEYITVYGGLELGLGIFYLVGALDAGARRACILLSVCCYPALAAFRIGAILVQGTPEPLIFGLGAVELSLALGSIYLWMGRPAPE